MYVLCESNCLIEDVKPGILKREFLYKTYAVFDCLKFFPVCSFENFFVPFSVLFSAKWTKNYIRTNMVKLMCTIKCGINLIKVHISGCQL